MVRQESLTIGKGISIVTLLFLLAIVGYLIANAIYWNRAYKQEISSDEEFDDITKSMYIVSIIGVVIGGILFLIWVFTTPILLRADVIAPSDTKITAIPPGSKAYVTPPPRKPLPPTPYYPPPPPMPPSYIQTPLSYPTEPPTPDEVWQTLTRAEKQIVAEGGCLPARVVQQIREAQDPCRVPAKALEQCKEIHSKKPLTLSEPKGFTGSSGAGFTNADLTTLGADLKV
jgi:hypothetical protein